MLRLILEQWVVQSQTNVVTVEGATGVSTLTGQDFNAVVQPIVRGEIFSVDRVLGGVGYGASTVYNLERQPDLSLNRVRTQRSVLLLTMVSLLRSMSQDLDTNMVSTETCL